MRTPVTLVVPCYNEEKRLRPDAFLAGLLAEPRLRFCFVDDGSTDSTGRVLDALAARAPERIEAMSLAANAGKGEAVRQGMRRVLSRGEGYVGYWDGDLATPLGELSPFVEALDRDADLDVVLGSRVRLLGRDIDRKLYRHLYGRVFATAVSVMLGLPVYDTQCGAKLFRVGSRVAAAFEAPFLSRWIFDVEILARLIGGWRSEGVMPATRILETPLRVWHEIPGSKIGPKDAIRAAIELRQLRRRYAKTLRAA